MILLPRHILLTIYSANFKWKYNQPVETEPMSFPPQWITIAFGSPKQFIIHIATDTMDNHRIPGIPAHSTLNPYLSNP